MIAKLEVLLGYKEELKGKRRQEADMVKRISFGSFSTRRLSEITKIKWDHVDDEVQRVLIKDMKGRVVMCGARYLMKLGLYIPYMYWFRADQVICVFIKEQMHSAVCLMMIPTYHYC